MCFSFRPDMICPNFHVRNKPWACNLCTNWKPLSLVDDTPSELPFIFHRCQIVSEVRWNWISRSLVREKPSTIEWLEIVEPLLTIESWMLGLPCLVETNWHPQIQALPWPISPSCSHAWLQSSCQATHVSALRFHIIFPILLAVTLRTLLSAFLLPAFTSS